MHTKQCKTRSDAIQMNTKHVPLSKQSRNADLRCIVLHTSTQCVLIMSEFIRSACKLSECEREAPRSRAQGRTGLARAEHTRARARAPLDFRAVSDRRQRKS